MTPQLLTLESRLTPASPFPEVPSTVLYLDSGTLHCAGPGGGPRVVRQDAADGEVWSVYVSDPVTRVGVNVEAVRLLVGLSGERVLSESVSQPPVPPAGTDPGANWLGGSWNTPRQSRYADDLYTLVDLGPTRYAVALVFDEPPGSADVWRGLLPDDIATAMYQRGIDPADYFIAMGPSISQIDPGSVRIDVRLSGPGPFDPAAVADEILGRLT